MGMKQSRGGAHNDRKNYGGIYIFDYARIIL